MNKELQIGVRVTARDKRRFVRLAASLQKTPSAWLRDLGRAAVERDRKKKEGVSIIGGRPVRLGGQVK